MIAYLARRCLYALPILFGVNLLTFMLFFVVNSPDDMARMNLGERHVTQEAIAQWKRSHGYDGPLLWNDAAQGVERVTVTIFYRKTLQLFAFRFGQSDGGRDIGFDIRQRMLPSLSIALPVFIIELALATTLGLLIALLRGSYLDRAVTLACIVGMSVSSLFVIIAGQYLVAKVLQLVPVSGYADGWLAAKFLALPILVQVVASLGAMVRWNRTVFLEELSRDFVRTARAKGLPEARVLSHHVLRNALLPLLTTVVVAVPGLFLGSLVTESFFAVPGLGSYTIDAIQNQDFAIVRAMVFLGSLMYIIGLVLTDISYAWADPRVRLAGTQEAT
ncbi:MAG: ABC transporter permease [Gammaproteobacteria bacterium]